MQPRLPPKHRAPLLSFQERSSPAHAAPQLAPCRPPRTTRADCRTRPAYQRQPRCGGGCPPATAPWTTGLCAQNWRQRQERGLGPARGVTGLRGWRWERRRRAGVGSGARAEAAARRFGPGISPALRHARPPGQRVPRRRGSAASAAARLRLERAPPRGSTAGGALLQAWPPTATLASTAPLAPTSECKDQRQGQRDRRERRSSGAHGARARPAVGR
jgi:hypothetical protein